MVPNGWSIKTLENLATVERGKFSARPRNDPKYYGGEIPFVQTGDIASAKTYLSSFSQTLNEDGLKVSRIFPKNSILITIAANIGDTAITSFDVACPDSLVGIQPKQDVDCFWLNSFLETRKDDLDGKATQNAQKNINLQVLKPLEILTPPYEEQRKIAKILSTWDKSIATTEKLIETSKQQKKALMQQLLTGKKRLVNPETGKAFEGEWEEATVGAVASLTAGGTPSTKHAEYWGGNIPWMNSGEINLKQIYSVEGRITTLGLSKSSTKEIPQNSVLIALAGQGKTRGTVAINRVPLCTNQSIAAIMPDKEKLWADFLYFNLDSRYKELRSMSTGDGGRGGLNLSILKAVKLLIPKLNEQQKITSVLTAADKEIEVLETKLAHFKHEKKALMQQILTGERRVKVDEDVAA
jgi:type I restriction enzyme S subunit